MRPVAAAAATPQARRRKTFKTLVSKWSAWPAADSSQVRESGCKEAAKEADSGKLPNKTSKSYRESGMESGLPHRAQRHVVKPGKQVLPSHLCLMTESL